MKRLLKILVVLAVLGGAGFGVYKYQHREEIDKVTVTEVTRGSVEETVSATGTVTPVRTVLVTADPGSRVLDVFFKEQDRVKEGQVLVQVDDAELDTQLSQHEENLRLLQSNLELAELNATRLHRLLDKGFAARQEVETADQQVNTIKNQIKDRQLSIELVKTRQARAVVTAPVTGIVTKKYVIVGGTLGGGEAPRAGGSIQQPLSICEIAELSSSQFNADVDQADIPKIHLPQPAVVRLDPFGGQTFPATAQEIGIGAEPDPTGRVRYQVKLQLQAPPGIAKVGMTGTASFLLAKRADAVTLSPALIVPQGDEEFVFVLDNDRARLRKIKTGLHGEDVVEVLSGLQAGDKVIDPGRAQGRAKLADGRRVEVVNAKRR
jgi:RND family efflux transporter MFP subunit